ncbi:MAG TPA: tetratricopeptide repeat protein, partial [Thermoleophilaceae bacterium]|nr:tetratricopeptide repeat protein [Thermoleophilaceae bacterium]
DRPWAERRFDLRVEDHPEPLRELRRLVGLRRAYDLADQAERLITAGNLTRAAEGFERALAEAPDNLEIRFWLGLALAGSGHVDEGRAHVQQAIADDPGWEELLTRLPKVGVLPDDPALMQSLLSEG